MGTWRRCPVVAGVIESEVDQHNTGQMASAMSGVAPPFPPLAQKGKKQVLLALRTGFKLKLCGRDYICWPIHSYCQTLSRRKKIRSKRMGLGESRGRQVQGAHVQVGRDTRPSLSAPPWSHHCPG